MIYFICDDVNEKEFCKLEQLKEKLPDLKVNCFVMGKDAGDYLKKDWVEVGVHGYEHTYPPECERSDQREFIMKGLKALAPYLPIRFGFRAPGFQLIASTYPILKELGFSYIAHQMRIQMLNFLVCSCLNLEEHEKECPVKPQNFKQGEIINTHIYDDLKKLEDLNGTFNFISEGIS